MNGRERVGRGRPRETNDRIRQWQTGSGDSHRSRGGRPARQLEEIRISEPFENGRILAWVALQECERDERFLQDILGELDSRHQLRSGERALAVDIAAGVVRRRRTLDRLIESRLTRPRSQTEPELWQILRIGAFQLLFARTPPHAAVDSAVQLCRQLGRDRWTGFVNGILRSLGRLVLDQPGNGPGPSTLPGPDGQWLALSENILPDPASDWTGWFADACSLPTVLAARWASRFSPEQLLTLGQWINAAPNTTLRINKLKADQAQVQQALLAEECQVSPGSHIGSLQLDSPARVERLPGYQQGWWSIQDESAMAASELLAPAPGERILDMCAAPGGKTTHLAELSGDAATILACDIAEGRLDRIRQNAQRLGLNSIQTLRIGKDGSGLPDGPFDAILLDVPCSNTGVLNRRPEARWRFSLAGMQELILIQTRLLIQAVERIRIGGRIVYSTCSLEPEENSGVVKTVLGAIDGLVLESQQQHLPGSPADGAYQAKLIRTR